MYMIQQAYKYVSLSLWPYLTFFVLKITYIFEIKWVGTGKECVAMETKCFIAVGVLFGRKGRIRTLRCDSYRSVI